LLAQRLNSGASGICNTQLRLTWELDYKAELRKTALPAGRLECWVGRDSARGYGSGT